jgi:uncharacterized repeat protein (TIGR04076 family)
MKLKDFKITITEVEGPCSRCQKGAVFYVRNARLQIPAGGGLCLFAMGSLLPCLIAASVPTDPENNILNITREFQCPDPLSRVIFRIDEIGGSETPEKLPA